VVGKRLISSIRKRLGNNGGAPPKSGRGKSRAPVEPDRSDGSDRSPGKGERRKQPAKRAERPWNISQFKVPRKKGETRFHDLDLPDEVMHAIADLAFQYCTPIQAEILPSLLQGVDAAGRAQTGTGKTAAFLIACFTHMLRKPLQKKPRSGTPRVLIIAPTRELALQIEKEARQLGKYCRANITSVIGGISYDKQKPALQRRLDVLVATPGRLLDLKQRHALHLGHVEILVIDEADRMLDMGFIPDVRRIIHSTPSRAHRQTLLFSATLTPTITRLASQWTKDPITVEIAPEEVAVESVEQVVYIITAREKFALLYNVLKQDEGQVLVFGNRRDITRRLTDRLKDHGIDCELLSGEVDQDRRLKRLDRFKSGKTRVLVATDVAGRGLHVEGISHVVNYNLPHDPEDYVHRIGRTGRAGATGTSISFACEEESFIIPDIEEYIGKPLKCTYPPDELLKPPPRPQRRQHPQRQQDRKQGESRSGQRRSGRPRGNRSRR